MNLRQAAQVALSAIEDGASFDHLDNVVAPMLRAALAEPEQEPVVQFNFEGTLPISRGGYGSSTPSKPQTTHWEGCEAVHPECKEKSNGS